MATQLLSLDTDWCEWVSAAMDLSGASHRNLKSATNGDLCWLAISSSRLFPPAFSNQRALSSAIADRKPILQRRGTKWSFATEQRNGKGIARGRVEKIQRLKAIVVTTSDLRSFRRLILSLSTAPGRRSMP
jgi:hypothetical protein